MCKVSKKLVSTIKPIIHNEVEQASELKAKQAISSDKLATLEIQGV